MLWHDNCKAIIAEVSYDFICSYTRDIFIDTKIVRNPSLMNCSLKYFHPTFFNISVHNCQFSGDLSLDFILTVASIVKNVGH